MIHLKLSAQKSSLSFLFGSDITLPANSNSSEIYVFCPLHCIN